MNNRERLARKAAIVNLLACYPALADKVGEDHVNAYLLATAEYPVEALAAACDDFMRGKVPGHNPAFAPTAPELAVRADLQKHAQGVIARRLAGVPARDGIVSYPIGGKPPEGFVPLGPIKADFGEGMVDMSAMSPAEKEALMTGNRPAPMLPSARLRKMSDQ